MNFNIIIGKPIVDICHLYDDEKIHLVTEERFLPNILVELKIFKSKSEVRKNRKDLLISLDTLDFKHIKIGKNHLWITFGN